MEGGVALHQAGKKVKKEEHKKFMMTLASVGFRRIEVLAERRLIVPSVTPGARTIAPRRPSYPRSPSTLTGSKGI